MKAKLEIIRKALINSASFTSYNNEIKTALTIIDELLAELNTPTEDR